MHKHCDSERQWPGSRGPAGYNKWELDGVGKFKTCLLPMITAESREWLRLHMHYRQRLLPLAGGLLNQPAAYLQAMEVLENGH